MRLATLLAVLCLLVCGGLTVHSDVMEEPETQTALSALPEGAKVIKNFVDNKSNGDLLCTQDAVYECDVDGDGKPETLVFYTEAKDETAEMHLAVIRHDGRTSAKLLASCVLDGGYFWWEPSGKPVLTFRERAGGGIVIYAGVAYGASARAHLVEISLTLQGKKVACKCVTLATDVETIEIGNKQIDYTLRNSTDIRHINMNVIPPATAPSTTAPASQPARG